MKINVQIKDNCAKKNSKKCKKIPANYAKQSEIVQKIALTKLTHLNFNPSML